MISPTWNGEPEYLRALGPEGVKAVVQIMLDEINELRVKCGLGEKTHQNILDAIVTKISDNSADITT